MHDTYRQFAITMGAAIKKSRRMRDKITETLNEEQPSVVDGVVALLVLAAGHAKEYDLGRDEFIWMCTQLYDSITLNNVGIEEDIITMPESQNN